MQVLWIPLGPTAKSLEMKYSPKILQEIYKQEIPQICKNQHKKTRHISKGGNMILQKEHNNTWRLDFIEMGTNNMLEIEF